MVVHGEALDGSLVQSCGSQAPSQLEGAAGVLNAEQQSVMDRWEA